MKHTLILFTLIAITGCSREDITENKQELKTDITPAVVDSTDNSIDTGIGEWKPGSHGEVDMEEKEE